MGVIQSVYNLFQKEPVTDRQTLIEQERSLWSYIVWDKISPINNIPASTFLERDDVKGVGDGEIYLIYKGGNLVYFQPHNPFQGGFAPMDTETVKVIAEKHIGLCVENIVNAKLAVVKEGV